MFVTENEAFGGLMKRIFVCMAIATETKNCEISTQNAKFVGKRLIQDKI